MLGPLQYLFFLAHLAQNLLHPCADLIHLILQMEAVCVVWPHVTKRSAFGRQSLNCTFASMGLKDMMRFLTKSFHHLPIVLR